MAGEGIAVGVRVPISVSVVVPLATVQGVAPTLAGVVVVLDVNKSLDLLANIELV